MANLSLAPGATVDPPQGFIRVWYLLAETNTVTYWDFAISPGMLMRDLRTLVARKLNLGLLAIGFADADSQLWPLDAPVQVGQRIIVFVGPRDATHAIGPYLSRNAAIGLSFSEGMNALIPLGLVALLSTPLSFLSLRLTVEAARTGTQAPATAVIRRIIRDEGFAALYRGALMGFSLVALSSIWKGALAYVMPQQRFLRYSLALVPAMHCVAFERTVCQPAAGISLISALVWYPSVPVFSAYMTALQPAIPTLCLPLLLLDFIDEHFLSEDCDVTRRLMKTVDGPLYAIARSTLCVLLTQPLHNVVRWVVIEAPERDPWQVALEVCTHGSLLYQYWWEAFLTDMWYYFLVQSTLELPAKFNKWRQACVSRRRNITDVQVVKRLLVESTVSAAAVLLGVGALFYVANKK